MKQGRVLLAAALFTLCGASAAHAGPKVMASAPANHIYPSNQTLYCDILNMDTKPRNVTIEIVDYNGAVTSGPFGPITLNPGIGFAFGEFSPSLLGAYCKFTVDGNPKKFRAVAIYDNGTEYTVAIPAY